MTESIQADVIVAGGGLAGLTAAAFAARAGRSVILCERARQLGGRAATTSESGFQFNRGPHAFYRRGAGMAVIEELGVRLNGRTPPASGGFAIAGGRKQALPAGFVSLLTTGLLRLPEKMELARTLAGIGRIDAAPEDGVALDEWLRRRFRHDGVRRLLEALFRLTTYVHAPERMSAGAAIRQLQLALSGNVLYLDGGWQTMVEGLRGAAEAGGVRVIEGTRVEAVEGGERVSGVRLDDGRTIAAAAVVLTGGPAEVSAPVRGGQQPSLRRRLEATIPARAACLDLGLSRLPEPHATFALGVDKPVYFSVHSAAAALAPAGAAMVHVARYLGPDDDGDPRRTEAELEALLDLVQPGWRPLVVRRQYLPRMTVTHDIPQAAAGGSSGRATVDVAGMDGLFVAGDWVGGEGMLADTSLASGKRAGQSAAAAAELRAAA